RAFEQRSQERSAIYAYEKAPAVLPPTAVAAFRKRKAAWTFFNEQPPSYRRVAIHWGRRGEERGDAGAPARQAHRRVGEAAAPRSVHAATVV
ncbi:MAG TPA: YdeI/OmpD-associated family protein, partial [Thermoanaerobaculia bacterium]|nr:YdeI/OmpD-associated family protein [Thermoanaerobaculia bacterium]